MKKQVPMGTVRFILPVISENGKKVSRTHDGGMRVQKQRSAVTIESNGTLRLLECGMSRVFNHVPGLEAIPLIIEWPGGANRTLRVTMEA
jgi:hypothetical protein